MKNLFITLLCLFSITLSGCQDSAVDSVKSGHLVDRQETTIGDAFEAVFNQPRWELKEAPNKAKYVVFTGITKQELPYFDIGAYLFKVPQNSPVTVIFLVDSENTFKVTGAEAAIEPYTPPLTVEGCVDGDCTDYQQLAWLHDNFIDLFEIQVETGDQFNTSSNGVQSLSEEGRHHLMLAIYGRR